MPLILRAYLGLTGALPGLLTRHARRAHARMGCAPDRLGERLGQPRLPRPQAPLIWIHAASVGELLSALDLARDMADLTGAQLLFTTMTQSSAQLAARRLPASALHQFLPVDTPRAVRGFLDHWQPDLACFVESDLWPRLVLDTHRRGIPLALINARPSSSREKAPRTMGYLMSCFARMTAQDARTRDQLLGLHLPADRIALTGDLKAAAAPLPHDPQALDALRQQIGPRPLWLAASTHPGEDAPILAAHRAALATWPDLLLILAPRHPERAPDIDKLLKTQGFPHATRSRNQTITGQTQVYLADTLGEMGLFFSLAPLVFMGASFSRQGGHNPFEPAQLGAAILHGPNVKNFQNDYTRLDQIGAALPVADARALGHAVTALTGSDSLAQMQQAGLRLMAETGQIRRDVLDHLRPILPRPLAPPAPRA